MERMELALKQDVLKEIREGQGRLLLHDEKEIKPGHFEIVPIWETVRGDEVKTPKEIYEEVIREGYQVDYLRVAIVSYLHHERSSADAGRPTSRRHCLPRCRTLCAVWLAAWKTAVTSCKLIVFLRYSPI